MLNDINGFTGVAEEVDFEESASLALSLHPDTEHIFIINDQTNTGNATQILIDEAFKPYQNAYEIETIRQFTWQDLQGKLAQLPPNSLIFLFVVSRDDEGIFLDYDEAAKILLAMANAPTYSVWDFYLGYGIVGGKLSSGSAQGEAAAKMALQVLDGQPIENIPVLDESPNQYMFDYRQLKKWKIASRSLPEGSTLVNNPFRDFFAKNIYWLTITGIGLLFLSLTILILILTVRKKTERLRQSNETLQEEVEERKKISKELEAQQTFTTIALDNVYTGVISCNLAGKPQDFNNTFLKLYGIPNRNTPFSEWRTHYTFCSPVNGEPIPIEEHPRILALQGATVQNAEFILKTKNKHFRVWVNSQALKDTNGKIVGTICTTYDITEHKEAQENFRRFVDASPIPTIIYSSTEQSIQFINQKFTEIFGYTKEDIPDTKTWLQKAFPDPEYREKVISVWGTKMSSEEVPSHTEVQVACKDGSSRTIEGHMAIIGENLMFLYNDVSERKEMENALHLERELLAHRVEQRTEELHIANAELSRASRMKDEFLASMSHELRTPLNAILGLSEGLQEKIYGPLNERQNKYIKIIEDSGHHLLTLINDILDLSKIEAGEMITQFETVDIQSLCQSSIKFIENLARKKNISISTCYDPQIQTLVADPRRLKQILVNLLNNAVKFTPTGGKVGLEIKSSSRDGTINFVVWDTGIGIAQENIKRLFRPFVQLDSSLSRSYEGTGLGLALVYRLTQMHGGKVNVSSELDKGSRFTITIPITQQAQSQSISQYVEAPSNSHEWIKHALIIEDSSAASEQITRYLHDISIESNICENGNQAFDEVLKNMPDVIILDILLPGKSGWDVLNQLKQHPVTQHIPVLVISIVDEPEKAKNLGASACLVKPISRQALAESLNHLKLPKLETSSKSIEKRSPVQPTILLAEDNPANAQTISDYLKTCGYQMMTASNGAEALQRMDSCIPSLILMDIQMPVMDGLETIKHIRENVAYQHLPVIALTALAMPGDRERCLEAGADDYLSKPVRLRKLHNVIERLLGKG